MSPSVFLRCSTRPQQTFPFPAFIVSLPRYYRGNSQATFTPSCSICFQPGIPGLKALWCCCIGHQQVKQVTSADVMCLFLLRYYVGSYFSANQASETRISWWCIRKLVFCLFYFNVFTLPDRIMYNPCSLVSDPLQIRGWKPHRGQNSRLKWLIC